MQLARLVDVVSKVRATTKKMEKVARIGPVLPEPALLQRYSSFVKREARIC